MDNLELSIKSFPDPQHIRNSTFLNAAKVKLLLQKTIKLMNGTFHLVFIIIIKLSEDNKKRVSGSKLLCYWAPYLRTLSNNDINWIQDELYALIDSSLQVSINLKALCTIVITDNSMDTSNLSLDLQVN